MMCHVFNFSGSVLTRNGQAFYVQLELYSEHVSLIFGKKYPHSLKTSTKISLMPSSYQIGKVAKYSASYPS